MKQAFDRRIGEKLSASPQRIRLITQVLYDLFVEDLLENGETYIPGVGTLTVRVRSANAGTKNAGKSRPRHHVVITFAKSAALRKKFREVTNGQVRSERAGR